MNTSALTEQVIKAAATVSQIVMLNDLMNVYSGSEMPKEIREFVIRKKEEINQSK